MSDLTTKLAEALRDAATSLETIGRLAGKPYYGLDDQGEPIPTYIAVRAYANARAKVARDAFDAQAATSTEQALPPLPEPAQTSYVVDSVGRDYQVRSYTADQMLAYARAAQPAQPLPVRDELEAGIWRDIDRKAATLTPPAPEAQQADMTNIESPFNACQHREHCKGWKLAATRPHQQQPAQAVPLSVPHPGSPEASAMIDSELALRGWPANHKNAARAGYEACRKLAGLGVKLAGGGEGV